MNPSSYFYLCVSLCRLVRVYAIAIGSYIRLKYKSSVFHLYSQDFEYLAGALRIAAKYEIPALRLWALVHLRVMFPSDILNLQSTSIPYAAGAPRPYPILILLHVQN
jgi:hypothetical protein